MSAPLVSVVIIFLNGERFLGEAIESVLGQSVPVQLIVVDDSSPDGTADLAEGLSKELSVRVLRRLGQRGLAAAVVSGWKTAQGDILGVMDADLQHPPEVVYELLKALRSQNADIAVASRYRPGGGTEGWSWFRRLVSWAGMRVGAATLPWTLGVVTDSGSGMFLLRAKALEGVALKPLGFKMLLEVLAKAHYQRVVEVPYVFRGRTRGASKLGARQYVEYLVHLLRIGRSSGELATWILYGWAGLAGAMVYLGALHALANRTTWPFIFTLLISLQLALLAAFLADETVSFRRARSRGRVQASLTERLACYEKLCLPGAMINGIVTFAGRGLGMELWRTALLGFLAGALWNFVMATPEIWRIWRMPLSDPRGGKV